jgi:hypothetical protein
MEMIQSLLILILAISGAYLYNLPYLTKRKRQQRRKNSALARQPPAHLDQFQKTMNGKNLRGFWQA